jgi:hypothetical protein
MKGSDNFEFEPTKTMHKGGSYPDFLLYFLYFCTFGIQWNPETMYFTDLTLRVLYFSKAQKYI